MKGFTSNGCKLELDDDIILDLTLLLVLLPSFFYLLLLFLLIFGRVGSAPLIDTRRDSQPPASSKPSPNNHMTKIAIVFYSTYGHIYEMAKVVLQ